MMLCGGPSPRTSVIPSNKSQMATTTMQAMLRCKRASMPPDPLDVDSTVDENLALKPCFAQNPLLPPLGFKC
jgi:hypothetical protein